MAKANSSETIDCEPVVDIETIDCEEADNASQQPETRVKRKLSAKPPLPSSKKARCPPKKDPYDNANNRRRSEVWNHVYDSPNSTPKQPRANCKYCKKEYACDTKDNGTSSMRSDVFKLCPSPKNPYTASRMNEVAEALGQPKLLDSAKLDPSCFDGSKSGVKPVLFNQDVGRLHLTKMIILDELPFDFVNGEGFKRYQYYMQPKFVIPSRFTVKRDVMNMYSDEKKKLKKLLKNERVCLTTDAWTSIQNLSYMCLTCHWIDSKWEYHKRILNFCLLPSHKGVAIGKAIEACLVDWDIEKILTITVDNASANNVAIKHLKKKRTGFLWKDTVSDHAFLHMRCCAHIVNLIVLSGVKIVHDSIVRIRNSVRYVRSSPSRTLSFESCVKASNVTCKHKVSLDVETRWNSTYKMLESAEKYESAFEKLLDDDGKYIQYFKGVDDDEELEEDEAYIASKGRGLKLGAPKELDWENSRVFIKFLKLFYDMTLKFSGSTFVTSNEFLHEVIHLHLMLKKYSNNDDPLLSSMANAMSLKFKKYWADFDGINGLVYVAVLLDPRYKIKYIKYAFGQIYDEEVGVANADKVAKILNSLYDQYSQQALRQSRSTAASSSSKARSVGDDIDTTGDDNDLRSSWERLVFEEHNSDNNSEVDRYFGEPTEVCKSGSRFCILNWWKANAAKYPILSQIARHVLAIPVSTVASEAAFSTGGRVLDPYRSSLAPSTVEALICTQNWLRSTPSLFDLKEIDFMVDMLDDDESALGTPPPPVSDTEASNST